MSDIITSEVLAPANKIISCSIDTTLATWEVMERTPFIQFAVPGVSKTGKPIMRNELRKVEGSKIIVRSDNGAVLHTSKPSYTPMTNESFIRTAEQFSSVTGFPLENIFEVGANGEKQLAYLKCTEPFRVRGFEFKDHLMIGNSHNGSCPFFIGNSNIMVRCENRFARQLRKMTVKHTKNFEMKKEDIVKEFAAYRKELEFMYANYERMAKIPVSQKLIDACVARVADMTKEETLDRELMSTRKKNIVWDLEQSIQTEMQDVGHTVLGVFEGVTHYTTHKRKNHALNVELSIFDVAETMNLAGYAWALEMVQQYN